MILNQAIIPKLALFVIELLGLSKLAFLFLKMVKVILGFFRKASFVSRLYFS